MTSSDNGITNAVELHTSPSGSLRILASNNDSLVRMFDAETFKLSGQFTFPWAVNYATASPTCPDVNPPPPTTPLQRESECATMGLSTVPCDCPVWGC